MIQPPTDSLYKFMAITGILLEVFIIVYPWGKAYDLHREATQLAGEMDVLELESEMLAASGDQSARDQSKIKMRQLRTKADVAAVTLEQNNGLNSIMTIVGVFASVLIALGFTLWYQKVQKYQDLILKQQAESVDTKEAKETTQEAKETSPAESPPVQQ